MDKLKLNYYSIVALNLLYNVAGDLEITKVETLSIIPEWFRITTTTGIYTINTEKQTVKLYDSVQEANNLWSGV